MSKKDEALKLALEHAKRDERHMNHAETRYWCRMYRDIAEKVIEALAEQPAQQQGPVERGGLRFYTNGTERQHWKADGSIDFKDKQGNVTMTIAANSITFPQPSKPLTDEEIEDIWADCPADWDDKINVLTLARAIEAAHGIKENT